VYVYVCVSVWVYHYYPIFYILKIVFSFNHIFNFLFLFISFHIFFCIK
jgi:hypothetical protein